MEHLKDYAEIISAWAAFVTVCVAIMELYNRIRTKKAESAMKIFADYLFIEQQLNYNIASVNSLVENCRKITFDEIQVFAKQHLFDTRIIQQVEKIERDYISNTNLKKLEGRRNAKVTLRFTGESLNIMRNVNSFYMVLVKGDGLSVDWVEENGKKICADYDKMSALTKQAGKLFHENLKEQYNFTKIFGLFLFVLSIIFIAVIFKDLWCHTAPPSN